MVNIPSKLKIISGIITSSAIVGAALWWALEPKWEQLRNSNLPCVSFPSRAIIETVQPGEWAVIDWPEIIRNRECGRPEIYAVISNGNGILHQVELSISGINLPIGPASMKYLMKLPDNVHPGSARFKLYLNFLEEGTHQETPWSVFTIGE